MTPPDRGNLPQISQVIHGGAWAGALGRWPPKKTYERKCDWSNVPEVPQEA